MTDATDPLAAQKRDVPREFDRIANRYDFLSRLNPGYYRQLRLSARRLDLAPDALVLDLCCGSGLSTSALRKEYPAAELHGLDASAGMLARARRRTVGGRIRFVEGDAMNPAAAGLGGPYDGILMAYGIRNLPDRDLALERIRQLLKPGGVICFHEYSVADSRLSRLVWNAVSLGVIIPFGAVTSPGTDIYRYLRRSVLEFDGVRAFEQRLRRVGFTDVRTEPMGGWSRGVLHSFLARRPT